MIGLLLFAEIVGTPNYQSGEALLALCQSERVGCTFYIEGAIDMLEAIQHNGTKLTLCAPVDLKPNKATELVMERLTEHPELRSEPAATLIGRALVQAYPCAPPSPVRPPAAAIDPAPRITDPAPGTTDPAPGTTDPAPGATDPAPGTTDPAPGATNPAPATAGPPPAAEPEPALPPVQVPAVFPPSLSGEPSKLGTVPAPAPPDLSQPEPAAVQPVPPTR